MADNDANIERMEALALQQQQERPRKGRGGGGGGRRGGGGGGGGQDREVLLSKALSMLLRHRAGEAGVELDGEGYARLDKVLQWQRLRSLKPSFAEIRAVVADNAKQRFSMKPAGDGDGGEESTDPADWLIRANQGHSIRGLDSEALHEAVTLEAGNLPPVVVHGTYFAFWPLILESGGLRRMTRTHVHFGTGLPEDGGPGAPQQAHDAADEEGGQAQQRRPKVVSGMRSDAEVLVFVDVAQSLRDGGMTWWRSSNDVILTEGDADGVVPLKYFKEVRGRRQGVGLLWKDGEKVADLPDNVVARVPQGKQGLVGGRGGGRGRRGGRGGGGRS